MTKCQLLFAKKKLESRNYGENKNCSEKLCQFYPLIFAGLFFACVNRTHANLKLWYIYLHTCQTLSEQLE